MFQNGEHQMLFWDTIYGAPYWKNKKYVVLFSPDFKYKVDSFNLQIVDNYVKKTIGRCIPRIEWLLAPKPLISFIDRIISSFL